MSRAIGEGDPEQWLEQCPQRVWDLWHQAYCLRPFGDEQLMLARIASLLVLLVAKNGVKLEDVLQLTDSVARAFMPADWIGQEQETKPIRVDVEGLAAFQDFAAKAFG